MMEFLDDDESIVMSLGSEKAKSRMTKLGMSRVQVYQLRTVARGQTPKNPVEMPKAPAVTAGSSPESRKEARAGEGIKVAGKELNITPETKAIVSGQIDVFDRRGGYSVSDATTGDEIKQINPRKEREIQSYSTLRFKTQEQAQAYAEKVNRASVRANKPTKSTTESKETKSEPKSRSSTPALEPSRKEFFKIGTEPFAVPKGSRVVIKKETFDPRDADKSKLFVLTNNADGKALEKADRGRGKLGKDRRVRFATEKAANAWAKKANSEIERFEKLAESRTAKPPAAKATRAKTTKPKETKPKEATPKKEPKSRWKPGDRILY